ncbi:hypothetical protein Hanom_Chr12g01147811 [Helianthus anomalus]
MRNPSVFMIQNLMMGSRTHQSLMLYMSFGMLLQNREIECLCVFTGERERQKNGGAGQLIAVSSPCYFPAENSCCHQFHSDT